MSPKSGPIGTRPRDGRNPKTPQQDAGMRIEPAESLPYATGTAPYATAAADPPLEPPTDRVRSHGLRHGPCSRDSVVSEDENSGTFVVPTGLNPAARYLAKTSSSCSMRVTVVSLEPNLR